MDCFNASEEIAFGSQPAPEDLKTLATQGVKTIINTRFPDEDQGELPPDRARAEAEALGIRYLNIPVSPVEFSPASLAEVSRALREAKPRGPAFVH